jgi:CDP-diacylglycerol--glycerol-3-phosphate 3-phosphatidyltransferase
MALTFANKITIVRILAVPFFIATVLYYSPQRDYFREVALAIFLFAVVSDVIDGYIARRHRQKTKAGAILDPVADKLLLISAFLCLYKVGVYFEVVRFPVWLVVTMISRDVILLLGAMIIQIVHGDIDIVPTIWGKASTFFQVFCVIGMFLQWFFSPVLWLVTMVFAIISGVDYIRSGIKVLNTPVVS